jgi:hypothetical protein
MDRLRVDEKHGQAIWVESNWGFELDLGPSLIAPVLFRVWFLIFLQLLRAGIAVKSKLGED